MLQLRKLLLLLFIFITTQLNAQIEVARLTTKNYSAIGLGAYLNFSIPVTESAAITAGAGFYNFKKEDERVALAPLLLGYRQMLNGSSTGLYLEPVGGYTLGGSDITKRDENGNPIYDEDGEVNQKVKGITAGVGSGYIFSGSVPINIGLQYRRVFVGNDPSLNLFSFRISYSLSGRGRGE